MDRKYIYTQEEIKSIQNMYFNNSRAFIMNLLNLSENQLRHVFKKYNIKKTKPVDNRVKDRNFLYEEYVVKGKSASQIAKELNCGKDTPLIYLKKFGIDIRPSNHYNTGYFFTKEELEYEYLELKQSISQISKKFNSSRNFIRKRLDEFDIPHKTMSEVQFDIIGKERPCELYDKKWLEREYLQNRKSRKLIAEELGVDPNAISVALNDFEIPIRNNSESKIGLMVGDKHHNWKNKADYYILIRQYVYDYIRPIAIDRDGWRCVICGETQDLHTHHMFEFQFIIKHLEEKYGSSLDLSNPTDRYRLFELAKQDEIVNDASNVITVCSKCHWNKIHGVENKEDKKYLLSYDQYIENKI